MTKAIELITRERLEQIAKHNHSIDSDVLYNYDEELKTGAVAILTNELLSFPDTWDPEVCSKIMGKTHLEKLTIAAALLAAEIDRLLAEQNNH